MYKIQANKKGSRFIDVSDSHLETIEKYNLLGNLVESHGYIDQEVVERLRLNVRSLLEAGFSNDKALLDLCLDVIYHSDMKAMGLQELIKLYQKWKQERQSPATPASDNDGL